MTKFTIAIFIVFVIPISVLLIFVWHYTYKKTRTHIAGYSLGVFWILFIVFAINTSYFEPVILTNSNIEGKYIIDKSKFPGPQANWQYENLKFEITKDNFMIFESKIYDNHWHKEKTPISYSTGYYDLDKEEYCNRKLRIHSDSTNHHIISDNPTLYRKKFNSFYYVFYSEKFGNVFFKKGKWKK